VYYQHPAKVAPKIFQMKG